MQASSLTIPKLKAELDARKISYKSNLKKAGLVDLLQAALADEEAATTTTKEDKGEGASTGKKRKQRESDASENAEASSSKSTTTTTTTTTKPSNKKSKPTLPPAPPPLPASILLLIKSHLSPFNLRSHLSFSGTSKHIRKTCYGEEQAWKELVLGAGFGKPTAEGKGKGAEGGEWKEVARALVGCPGYEWNGKLEGGWEGFRDSLLASKSLFKPLTPEDIVSSETVLETNPLMRTIEVSNWTSMAGVTCCNFEDGDADYTLGGVGLTHLRSVGFALATCPAVTYLGVEQGFSSVKNVDGVTILDVWQALVSRANEKITEAQLLSKFVRDEDLKDSNQNTWSYPHRTKYSAWISTTGLRTKGWALKESVMFEKTESFNGDVSQASAGSILFSLGFNEAGRSDDDDDGDSGSEGSDY